jgi:multidrug efflux pump
MLGVTAFGIFLTPVFFFVVEKLSETHLFKSGPLRKASDFVLGILSFRGWMRATTRSRPQTPVRSKLTAPKSGEPIEH